MNIDKFLDYIENEQKKSANTVEAYGRDIRAFETYIESEKHKKIEDTTNTDVVSYVMDLKNDGKSKATINRKLSSIKAFFKYLIDTGMAQHNPVDNIKMPKLERKAVDYLTIPQVDQLLELPDETPKGIRDKAILEVMYATGVRVTELIEMTLGDLNLHMGFVSCNGNHGKARIVPLGSHAKEALDRYLNTSREHFMRDKDSKDPSGPLFVNYRGEVMTRQGLWKILKFYGEKAELEDRMTPHLLRNSFAVHLLQNGADVKTLQELMGLEDMQAMQAYLSVTKNRIKEVYDKTHPRA